MIRVCRPIKAVGAGRSIHERCPPHKIVTSGCACYAFSLHELVRTLVALIV